jgi:hypothetical protein
LPPIPTDQPWCDAALAAAEKFADGELPVEEWKTLSGRIRERYEEMHERYIARQMDFPWEEYQSLHAIYNCCATADLIRSAHNLLSAIMTISSNSNGFAAKNPFRINTIRMQCAIIRDIALFPSKQTYIRSVDRSGFTTNNGNTFLIGESVLAIAVTTYAEQAFDRLPILADALEDAGLTDEKMLSHLRSSQNHYRGCWALDLILGRS